MNEIMTVLALMLSESQIIGKLEDALKEYKVCPTSTNHSALLFSCQLMMMKHLVGEDAEKAHDLIKDMKGLESLSQMMNVKPN